MKRKIAIFIFLAIVVTIFSLKKYRQSFLSNIGYYPIAKQEAFFASSKNFERELAKQSRNLEMLICYAEGEEKNRFFRYKKLMELFPQKPILYARLGILALKEGNKRIYLSRKNFNRQKNNKDNIDKECLELASWALQKGLKVEPDNALYNYLLADIYFFYGKEKQALELIDQGVKKPYCKFYYHEIGKLKWRQTQDFPIQWRYGVQYRIDGDFMAYTSRAFFLQWYIQKHLKQGEEKKAIALIVNMVKRAKHIREADNKASILRLLQATSFQDVDVVEISEKKAIKISREKKMLVYKVRQLLLFEYLNKLFVRNGKEKEWKFIQAEIKENEQIREFVKRPLNITGFFPKGVWASLARILLLQMIILGILGLLYKKKVATTKLSLAHYLFYITTLLVLFALLTIAILFFGGTAYELEFLYGSVDFFNLGTIDVISNFLLIVAVFLILALIISIAKRHKESLILPTLHLIPVTIFALFILYFAFLTLDVYYGHKIQRQIDQVVNMGEYNYLKEFAK